MVVKGSFNAKFVFLHNATKPIVFVCPYCSATLAEQKQHKHFRIHKCNNSKCSYYQDNLKKLPKYLNHADKYKYKLHYIYTVSSILTSLRRIYIQYKNILQDLLLKRLNLI